MAKTIFSPDEVSKFNQLASTYKYSIKELTNFFPNRSENQIKNYCSNNNIRISNKIISSPEEWTDEEILKLKTLLETGNYQYTDLPKFFPNRTLYSIKSKAQYNNLHSKHRCSQYTFDQHYFDSLTLENCYWAGFIMADGNLLKVKNKNSFVFSLLLAIKDLDHLQKFKKSIKSDHPIITYKKKSPRSDFIGEYCRISIGGVDNWMPNLLNIFGMRIRKTNYFSPPKLTKNIEKFSYCCGYFDGDGCLSYQKNHFTMNVVSSNKLILEYIRDFFISLNLPKLKFKNFSSKISLSKSKTYYSYTISGFQACIIHELISRIEIPKLKRKWENPEIIEIIKYWKSKPEWPNELFFQNILNS